MLKLKLVLLGVMAAGVGHAGILFTNEPADLGHALPVSGSGWEAHNSWATSFDAPVGWALSQISVAVGDPNLTGTRSIILALYQDNGSGIPGALLDSQPVSLPSSYSGLVGAPFSNILAAGTYWVGVLPATGDTLAWWYQNSGLLVTQAFSGDGGSTWYGNLDFYPGVIQVQGTAAEVPEPSSILLLASAAGVLGIAIRRKRSTS